VSDVLSIIEPRNVVIEGPDGATVITVGTQGPAGPGSGISDGDKGDITVSGDGTQFTIDNGAVNIAKLGGDITSAGKALLDDASAAAQRTTLGLGTAAVVDVPSSGDATSSQAVKGNDSRLSDARTPTAHAHAIADVTGLQTALDAKIAVSNIVNTLTSTATNQPLSAAQGKALKDLIDTINTFLISDETTLDTLQEIVDFIQLNRADLDTLSIASIAGLQAALDGKAASSHTHTASQVTDFDTEVSNNTDVAANTSARHSHSNKALLDTYAQTEANLADAVAKKHAHANQGVLDGTTASFTTSDETKLDGIEAGAEVNPTGAEIVSAIDSELGGSTWQGGGGGGGSATEAVSPGQIPLTGVKYVSGYIGNMSTGDNIMYTAPAGKRAMINAYNVFNANASARNFYPIWRIGGVNYKFSGVLAVSAGAMNQVATSVNIILEPGESFGINVTGSDVNAWARIVEYDDFTPIYAAKKVGSWSSGDNTIYTVPTGKNAILIDGVGMVAQNVTSMNYYNLSGGSRTIQWHSVPNGGSPSATTRVSGSVAVGNDTRSTQVMSHSLNSGDFIVLNTNATTNTQLAWVMVMELPN
jgi:hypothetical protein